MKNRYFIFKDDNVNIFIVLYINSYNILINYHQNSVTCNTRNLNNDVYYIILIIKLKNII